ncbi:hypothetical protein [Novosphingobium colocasiae]
MPRRPFALRTEPSADRWNPYVKAGCALLIVAWINGIGQFIALTHLH